MIRAVVDSNVFVSGLLIRDSVPDNVIDAWLRGQFELVVSTVTVDELEEVLARPRIRSRLSDRYDSIDLIVRLRSLPSVVTDEVVVPQLVDETDLKFIEVAVAGEADYIVSGDSDLLELVEVHGVQVVTPRRFLAILQAQEF